MEGIAKYEWIFEIETDTEFENDADDFENDFATGIFADFIGIGIGSIRSNEAQNDDFIAIGIEAKTSRDDHFGGTETISQFHALIIRRDTVVCNKYVNIDSQSKSFDFKVKKGDKVTMTLDWAVGQKEIHWCLHRHGIKQLQHTMAYTALEDAYLALDVGETRALRASLPIGLREYKISQSNLKNYGAMYGW